MTPGTADRPGTSPADYGGGELELFAQAARWKAHWGARLRPYLGRDVLEVGAGIGSNTLALRRGTERRWLCLEPDAQLAAALGARIAGVEACRNSEVRVGTLAALPPAERFDTILYLDVLEHIENDRAELAEAALHLGAGGHLAVLAPAHPWLYSAFDRQVGHYRRYTARTLAALEPPNLRCLLTFHLDAAGLLLSAANRLLLRQSLPTAAQLAFWDRWVIPCSRLLDPLAAYRLGRSVVAVWQRAA